jgi:arylesterase/paraoxonase
MYDHTKKTLKKLSLENFKDKRGLHVHGFDVVQDKSDPSLLWVYVINHRPQREAGTEHHHGADEAIEIFKTTPGGNSLVHVRTFDDPSVIITPNDVSGSPDGQSFFFTNDNPSRVNKVCGVSFLPYES